MIVASLFSGVLCSALKKDAARYYTAIFEAVLLAMSAALIFYCMTTGASVTYPMGEFPAPWGNEIRFGLLESLMAAAFVLILLVSVTAGSRFVRIDIDGTKQNLYYSLVNLLTAALLSMVFTNDIFTGYVFLEILTLTSCGILIVREIGRTTLAAVRYMVLNLLGSGLFLLGVVLLYDVTGQLLMVPMREVLSEMAASGTSLLPLSLSIGILTIGLAIKSGLFPFHFWMPDTYGWATPTSASILSSLVSKAYIFLLMKIYIRAIGPEVMDRIPIRKILFVLGICGMVFGSVSAMRKKSINRMVAFSSASQIGYIYMGIGIGGTAGYTAAIFHILTHALTKSQLFLTTPRLAEVSGGSLLFKNLTGSARRAKTAGFFFLMGSLSMIGVPIFAGFSSKLLFSLAALDSGNEWKMLLTMLALGASSVLSAMYFLRTVLRIYTSGEGGSGRSAAREYAEAAGVTGVSGAEASDADQTEAYEEPEALALENEKPFAPAYLVPMTVLTAANIFLGLFSWVLVDMIEKGLAAFM